MNKIISTARLLRKNMTPQELKFWKLVRNHKFKGLEFRRQQPIGSYIVDFICREKWLIVEIDGGQHNNPVNIEQDRIRSDYLNSRGFKVLRFWNNDIDENIEGVITVLDEHTN